MPFPRTMWFSLAAILFLLTSNSCSNDPASSEPDEPEAPELPIIAPHLSENLLDFFYIDLDIDALAGQEEYTGYLLAEDWIGYVRLGDTGQTFIDAAVLSKGPVYLEGEWVWEFRESEEAYEEYEARTSGQGSAFRKSSEDYLDHRLVARRVEGGIEWTHSLSGMLDGEPYEAPLYMKGFISDDGSIGTWSYYSIDDIETPWQVTEWKIESDSKMTYKTVYAEKDEEDEDDHGVIEYIRNAPENHVTTDIWVEIYWNEETGHGWITTKEGGKICYDRNNEFKNRECEETGK